MNAVTPLQVIQRPLYELVGQRMGNARWCQLPLQLPCHKKAVSLSFCSPRQYLCGRAMLSASNPCEAVGIW